MSSKKRKAPATQVYHIPAEAVEGDYLPTIAYVDELSRDGRRVRRQDHLYYAPPAETRHPIPTQLLSNDYFGFDNTSGGRSLDDDHTINVQIEEEDRTRRFVSSVRSTFYELSKRCLILLAIARHRST